MKTVFCALAVIAVALAGCAEQAVSPPSVPKFTAIKVSKGATVSKEITSAAEIDALSAFLLQPRSDWRTNGRLVTPTVGDVALVLYSGAEVVELVEFSDQRLLVGDLIANITPEEVDRLLQITGLTRYDAFTPDREKERQAKKPVETTSVARPEIRESCSFSIALRSVSHG